MKLRLTGLIVFLLLLMPVVVYAGYYQYTDQNGVVRYTDDPSLIPPDQRDNTQAYESDYSEPYVSEQPLKTEAKPVVKSVSNDLKTDASGENAASSEKEAELNATKAKLKQMYQDLQAEKDALGDPPPEDAKRGVQTDYFQKSQELNKKIEEYNQLSNEFDREVKEYNSQIGQ